MNRLGKKQAKKKKSKACDTTGSKTVPAWTTFFDKTDRQGLVDDPDIQFSRLYWQLRDCGPNEIARLNARFINDQFKQFKPIMNIVSRIVNLGEDLHSKHFEAGEKESALSFQSDTWKRARRVIRQDDERDYSPKDRYNDGVERIEEIDPPSPFEDIIHSVIEGGFEIKDDEEEIEIVEPRSRMGVFSVHFWGDGGLIVVRVPTAVTDGVVSQNIVVGSEKDLKRWAKIWATRQNDQMVLSPGIYVGRVSNRGLSLEEKEIPEVPAVHPKAERIQKEADRFFDNVDQFLRHGRYGMRTIMLQGPPGTGKTTIANEIARKKSEEAVTVFANDANTMYKVQHQAADEEAPAIIVVEDAEQAINVSATGGDAGDVAGANSEILNMLDGHNCARNPAGCLIFLLTNRPTEIESRIRDRPGRVDSIYTIGPIEDEDLALKCAKIYLPESHSITDEDLKKHLNGLSGAEIMTVCDKSAAVATSRGEDITSSILKEMVEQLEDQLTAAEKYQDYKSKLKEDEGGKFFDPSGEE